MKQSLLAAIVLSIALLVAACDSGGGSASDSVAASEAIATTTVATTTSLTPSPPPPLTHKQFVRRLDRLCKVGNRIFERKFKFSDIYDTAESLDAYAVKLKRANRYNVRWDRRHHFFTLDPGEPEDIRNYDRYKALTYRLRNYFEREVRAARQHSFEEILRLTGLEERTRNRRTSLTADMGLRFCGA
jgi:hypothetical protein